MQECLTSEGLKTETIEGDEARDPQFPASSREWVISSFDDPGKSLGNPSEIPAQVINLVLSAIDVPFPR